MAITAVSMTADTPIDVRKYDVVVPASSIDYKLVRDLWPTITALGLDYEDTTASGNSVATETLIKEFRLVGPVPTNPVFAIGETIQSYETLKVYVNGALKVLDTDYSVAAGNITFINDPKTGNVLKWTKYVAGTRVWNCDRLADAAPDYCAAGEALVVYVNSVLKTVTTDYTYSNGVVTFTDGSIPAAGLPVVIAWTGDHDQFNIGQDLLAGETLQVYVGATLKTLTTDYTVSNGVVTFEVASIPAADAVVSFKAIHTTATTTSAEFTLPQQIIVPGDDEGWGAIAGKVQYDRLVSVGATISCDCSDWDIAQENE